ncbi:MAG TPA: DNA polymerase I [Actinomycetota bacterium]|nr:DNA polymerase I [Actinomycetota bacterium]
MASPRLFLLDGHSLAFRAFFALPSDLATTSGQVTNAVYGFTSMLIKLLGEERPDLLAVAFDVGKPTVRLEKYAEYKAGRAEAPDEFRQQLGLIVEVLETLRVPVLGIPGHEADDVIATLAVRAAEEGIDVTIVTADRDFFQLVRPGITVMFNRRGISDIVRYDAAAVTERFGLPPEKYLDYVALKGDTSDNIPGIAGVGEKTASRVIQEFGSVEELLRRLDEAPPKIRAAVEAGHDLALNKDLARLVTDLDLDARPEDLALGEWDPEAVRRLFNSLEFRTLLERLEDLGRTAKPALESADLDLSQGAERDLGRLLAGDAPRAVTLAGEPGRIEAIAVSAGGGQAVHVAVQGVPKAAAAFFADPGRPKWVHDAKELATLLEASGVRPAGVAFDTMLAGYLLDPAETGYALGALTERYLGVDVVSSSEDEGAGKTGQLFGPDWRAVAAQAAAVALLAPLLAERVERAGLKGLLEDVELPLAQVLARMQAAGVAIDVPYLQEMSETLGDRMATLEQEIYRHAGEPFNLNSPPQLRVVLYERLGLMPSKRTSKGALSTDASVLEKLREQHPIIDALLQYREYSKLKSTYLDALPPLVDPRDGRLHTTYVQTAATTGRLSSTNPNLQNIPIRGELGRQIRRAFIPGSPGEVLFVADYSQIELRVLAHLSGDENLARAFASDTDIHLATAATIAGLPPEAVDPEWRRRAKMVNYGLAYGMSAYGLAQRLGIAPDEAQEFIDAYFAGFPKVREFLDRQVATATTEGFTATILGRRRYLPELQSANPRMRDMGRRMALNAPIQGTAADIMKLGMIRVDEALEASGLPARMVLTVHDELVFEVPQGSVDKVSDLVKREMEAAYPLEVPLRVDLGSGANWADAAPAGH